MSNGPTEIKQGIHPIKQMMMDHLRENEERLLAELKEHRENAPLVLSKIDELLSEVAKEGNVGEVVRFGHMKLCFLCGNKRCPHATDSELACTGSNEPGQIGSRYE